MKNSVILNGIREALQHGESTINLQEASALTGSGSGVGGRVIYDDAFASKREHNPLRDVARKIITSGSDEAFVVKTGNATLIQSGSDNPWGYPINNNTGSPNIATSFWQLPVRCINASVPVRTAVLSDINYLEETIAEDLWLEFSQQEALGMMFNDDQAGSTTVNYGATSGLRGLNSYAGSTSSASFGSSGSGITNGLHTVLEVNQGASAISYDDLANLQGALPAQYLFKPSTAWMMHPTTIQALRKLKASSSNVINFIESGEEDGGAVVYIFGHPVIPNPYMDVAGSGKYPVYLANWERFVTIADNEEMKIQLLEQSAVGFITFYAEKRVCSTIRDVFAGVRLYGA